MQEQLKQVGVTAVIDPGKGRVYTERGLTWKRARAMVRGPYMRDCRIVLKQGEKVELYERGSGSLAQRRVQS